RGSAQLSKPIEVKETLNACVTQTADGLQLGPYVLKKIIGKGAYGIVNLGYNLEDGEYYAIKEFSKSMLRKKDRTNLYKLGRGSRRRRGPESTLDDNSSPLELIRGEIAILKKLNHDNIVKLYEVLDASAEDSMFMVHVHDIVHRDIKPDNLLRSSDGTLKIVDFGVSKMFSKKGDDMTERTAGSPAFMAPELCRLNHGEISGRAADVWSMGVTLYCIRYGKLPFRSRTPMDLKRVIRGEAPDLEAEKDPRFKRLMTRLLQKEPSKRITIDELRVDPWLTDDGRAPLMSKDENTQNVVTEVTEDDMQGAFKNTNKMVTLVGVSIEKIARVDVRVVSMFKRLISRSPSPAIPGVAVAAAENNGDDDDSATISSGSSIPSTSSSPIIRSEHYMGAEEKTVDIPPIQITSVVSDEPSIECVVVVEDQEKEKYFSSTTSVISSSTAGESIATKPSKDMDVAPEISRTSWQGSQ
ncbi:hypothetical protein BGZ65_004063, partial [Modicella reniformis]